MEVTQATMATMIRGAYADLGKVAANLGEKATWKPMEKGRSALNQVHEVAGIALFCAAIFEAQKMVEFDSAGMGSLQTNYDTLEKALPFLTQAGDKAAKAIEAFPPEKMGETVVLPFGGGMEKSFAEVAMMTYWNAVYHEGQVNYIETLL